MKNLTFYLALPVILALGPLACGGANLDAGETPAANATSAPDVAAAATQEAGQNSTPVPASTGLPPQSNAAQIMQPDRREELTRLSNLMGFRVVSQDGTVLGNVADFIINTCETYLVYVVMDPAGDLNVEAGNRPVFPFELVTINSGALDAEAKAIVVYPAASLFASAPTITEAVDLIPDPDTWEQPVRSYWKERVRVGKLSSACAIDPANPIYKVAYASLLLKAELKDGNANVLGQVQEAIVEPESGKLGFYVVSLADNSGLVLVPLAQTNLPKEEAQAGNSVELVLLSQPAVLAGAPHFTNVEEAVKLETQNSAREYWAR